MSIESGRPRTWNSAWKLAVLGAVIMTAAACENLPPGVPDTTGGPTVVLEPRIGKATYKKTDTCPEPPCWRYYNDYTGPAATNYPLTPKGSIFKSMDGARSACWLRTDMLGLIRDLRVVDAAGVVKPLTDLEFKSERHTITANFHDGRLRWTAHQDGYHYCDRPMFQSLAVEQDKLAWELFTGEARASNEAGPVDLEGMSILFVVYPIQP